LCTGEHDQLFCRSIYGYGKQVQLIPVVKGLDPLPIILFGFLFINLSRLQQAAVERDGNLR
jgi:hypothetical protein